MSLFEGAAALSNEAAVAKVAKERNDNAPSGNSDQEMPSKKLSCYHRLYNWPAENKTKKVTCDSKSDKCAYVSLVYYNTDKPAKRIVLLSQHCNHQLGKRKRTNHCKRMEIVVKNAAG